MTGNLKGEVSWREMRRHVRQEPLEFPKEWFEPGWEDILVTPIDHPSKREGTGAIVWLWVFCAGALLGLVWQRLQQ